MNPKGRLNSWNAANQKASPGMGKLRVSGDEGVIFSENPKDFQPIFFIVTQSESPS